MTFVNARDQAAPSGYYSRTAGSKGIRIVSRNLGCERNVELREQRLRITDRFKGFKEVFDRHDVDALAALLTEDAVRRLKISITLRNIVAGSVFV